MLIKTVPARVKAVGSEDGLAEGQFEAIVSVFGNVDSYGDVVMGTAFDETLKSWSESGDPIPVIWSHDWSDPFAHIGRVIKAEARPEGLWVQAQIDDLDAADQNPKAAQVHRLLRGRRITQFSFAYDVLDASEAERDGKAVYELRKLKLYEVGPCLIGVNQETELLAAKGRALATELKEGRVLSTANLASLRNAHQAIGEVIVAAEKATPQDSPPAAADEGRTTTSVAGQPDEPAANDESRAAPSSASQPAPKRSAQVDAVTQLTFLSEMELYS